MAAAAEGFLNPGNDVELTLRVAQPSQQPHDGVEPGRFAVGIQRGGTPGSVAAHDRDWRIGRQLQGPAGIDGHQRFHAIPNHQRQIHVRCVFGVGQQPFGDPPAIVDGQPLQGRREIEPHDRGIIIASHAG